MSDSTHSNHTRAARRTGGLGIYLDGDFCVVSVDGVEQVGVHPADYALVGRFLLEVGSAFDSLVLFGRADRRRELGEYVALPPSVDFVALPYYATLTQLGAVAGAASGTVRASWRGLERVDTIWVFGPHPFSLMFAALARMRGKAVVLGVRQDTLAYFRARLPSRRWAPAMLPIHALDGS